MGSILHHTDQYAHTDITVYRVLLNHPFSQDLMQNVM